MQADSGFQIRNRLSILPFHTTFPAMSNLTKRDLVMQISKETGIIQTCLLYTSPSPRDS